MAETYLLAMRCPVLRRRDSHSGFCTELENLDGDGKGKGTSGQNRETESTDAPTRGSGVMPVERSEQVIAVEIGSTGNGRSPIFNGRRQPSSGGTSRMMREYQVRNL